MYPGEELKALARHKEAIRHRIARERAECIAAAQTAARPLRWLDRLQAWWRTVPGGLKFAAGPLAFLLQRKIFSKKKRLGLFARWFPLAWKLARAVGGSVILFKKDI